MAHLTIALLIISLAVFSTSEPNNEGYRKVVRSVTAIGGTDTREDESRTLWVIKSIQNYYARGTDLWSPKFSIPACGNNVHFYNRLQVSTYDGSLILHVYHAKESEFSKVRWRLMIGFLNSTTGESKLSGRTTGYYEKLGHLTSRETQIEWTWKQSEFISKVGGQEDLLWLTTVFVTCTSKSNEISLNYLKTQNLDCSTHTDFGKKLLLDKKYCDTAIEIGSETFCTHRAILVHSYPESFKSLIDNGEIVNGNGNIKIQLDGIDASTFRDVLHFVYTDEAPGFASVNATRKLILASDRLKLSKLRSICLEHISKSMTTNDALDWMRFASENNIQELVEFGTDYWRNNAVIMGNQKWTYILNGYNDLTCKAKS